MTDGRPVLVITANAAVGQRVSTALEAAGYSYRGAQANPDEIDPATVAVVVDLDTAGALELPETLRRAYPTALIAAFISLPDRERWEAATEAGFDLVSTRGALSSQLLGALETWRGPRSGVRFRLFEADDATGRLGAVYRGDTPAGPVAVYKLGKEMYAVGDTCPHAGATLSEGKVSEGVVTCPKHGSQFDIRDGARVRGPSDDPIASFEIVVEDGIVYIVLEED